MQKQLKKLARSLESRPWNRPGVDKTWVLKAMSEHAKFMREAKKATRVSGP